MNGEQKYTVVLLGVVMLCFVVLFTFVALWPYRVYVGLCFLGVLLLLACVYVRGKLNEQELRHQRVHYRKELPLDRDGIPFYIPAETHVYPSGNRSASPYNGQQQHTGGYHGHD